MALVFVELIISKSLAKNQIIHDCFIDILSVKYTYILFLLFLYTTIRILFILIV